ncbi:MAG: hypothetical protein IT259_03460 [Saprospiraceae bacterium]|nr:hypothetical protein [Saprospiraceae bacterium]
MTTFARIYLLLLPVLIGSGLVYGQNKRLPGLELAPGDTTAAILPLVKIYKAPTANSRLIGQASEGHMFIVKQKTDVSAEFDGITQFWYEVAFGKEMNQTGFVFGPWLASGFAQTPDGTRFLLRVMESGNDNTDAKQVDIKVVGPDGPLVTFLRQIPIAPDDSLVVRRRDSLDFQGYTNMIVFDFVGANCPDRHRELGVLWNGTEAMQMPMPGAAERPQNSCFSYQYILPGDPGGEPGLLKIRVQKTATQIEWVKFRLKEGFGFIEIRD